VPATHEILVVFDLDGTLVEAADPDHRHAFEHALRAVYGVPATLDGLRLGGRLDLEIAQAALSAAGVRVDHADERLVRVMTVMGRHYGLRVAPGDRTDRLLAGVVEVLRKLRAAGIATAVGTGSATAVARAKLAAAEIADYLPVGAYGDDVVDRAELLMLAAERSAVHYRRKFLLANTVVIGDTPADIAAGRAVGARVVAVATGRYAGDELDEHGPDAIFTDLANADAIVKVIRS